MPRRTTTTPQITLGLDVGTTYVRGSLLIDGIITDIPWPDGKGTHDLQFPCVIVIHKRTGVQLNGHSALEQHDSRTSVRLVSFKCLLSRNDNTVYQRFEISHKLKPLLGTESERSQKEILVCFFREVWSNIAQFCTGRDPSLLPTVTQVGVPSIIGQVGRLALRGVLLAAGFPNPKTNFHECVLSVHTHLYHALRHHKQLPTTKRIANIDMGGTTTQLDCYTVNCESGKLIIEQLHESVDIAKGGEMIIQRVREWAGEQYDKKSKMRKKDSAAIRENVLDDMEGRLRVGLKQFRMDKPNWTFRLVANPEIIMKWRDFHKILETACAGPCQLILDHYTYLEEVEEILVRGGLIGCDYIQDRFKKELGDDIWKKFRFDPVKTCNGVAQGAVVAGDERILTTIRKIDRTIGVRALAPWTEICLLPIESRPDPVVWARKGAERLVHVVQPTKRKGELVYTQAEGPYYWFERDFKKTEKFLTVSFYVSKDNADPYIPDPDSMEGLDLLHEISPITHYDYLGTMDCLIPEEFHHHEGNTSYAIRFFTNDSMVMHFNLYYHESGHQAETDLLNWCVGDFDSLYHDEDEVSGQADDKMEALAMVELLENREEFIDEATAIAASRQEIPKRSREKHSASGVTSIEDEGVAVDSPLPMPDRVENGREISGVKRPAETAIEPTDRGKQSRLMAGNLVSKHTMPGTTRPDANDIEEQLKFIDELEKSSEDLGFKSFLGRHRNAVEERHARVLSMIQKPTEVSVTDFARAVETPMRIKGRPHPSKDPFKCYLCRHFKDSTITACSTPCNQCERKGRFTLFEWAHVEEMVFFVYGERGIEAARVEWDEQKLIEMNLALRSKPDMQRTGENGGGMDENNEHEDSGDDVMTEDSDESVGQRTRWTSRKTTRTETSEDEEGEHDTEEASEDENSAYEKLWGERVRIGGRYVQRMIRPSPSEDYHGESIREASEGNDGVIEGSGDDDRAHGIWVNGKFYKDSSEDILEDNGRRNGLSVGLEDEDKDEYGEDKDDRDE